MPPGLTSVYLFASVCKAVTVVVLNVKPPLATANLATLSVDTSLTTEPSALSKPLFGAFSTDGHSGLCKPLALRKQ